jgi:hypothetical protein
MRLASAHFPLAFLLLASLSLSGCCSLFEPSQPHGLELAVSERLDPSVSVFVLDPDQKRITSIEGYGLFFHQQSGLPEGTEYGFRVMRMDGSLIMPVYETFKAKSPEQIKQDGMETGNRYYHDLQGGKYVLELLTIRGDEGTVVARMDFSSITRESLDAGRMDVVRIACANVTNISAGASGEENKSYRDRIISCVTDAAVSMRDPETCGMIFRGFNIPNFQDVCTTAYAYATGDISACDNNSMPKARGFCRAKVSKDWTECTRITCDVSCAMEDLDTQKDFCVQWYAVENRNASLCEEVKASHYREICVGILKG